MPFHKTEFSGLLVFEPSVYEDNRGYFFESYNEQTFLKENIDLRFVQDNQSSSSYGVIRGLHYQLNPHAQTKLVRVLSGTVLDVAVDIRDNSPTFAKAFSIELSADNKKQLLIPPGFAHGFLALTDNVDFLYKCTDYYAPEWERSVIWNDPQIGIDWPLEPGQAPALSAKDAAGVLLKDAELLP